jgi:hypothetical protein
MFGLPRVEAKIFSDFSLEKGPPRRIGWLVYK